MLSNRFLVFLYFLLGSFITQSLYAQKTWPSVIESVKLYRNQAQIQRSAQVELSRGENQIILNGLPPLLQDWSVRARLPRNIQAKIVNIEVEKKALLERRQKKILEIENKLDELREKDRELIDRLAGIRQKEKFLNSLSEFSNQTASDELKRGMPQIKVWQQTLNFMESQNSELKKSTRLIEIEREELGKRIQKLEFELSQIAGYSYLNKYRSLNKNILDNRASLQVQQFSNSTSDYAERLRLLENPQSGVDTEKRVVLTLFSKIDRKVNLEFEYMISSNNWNMKYDIRASEASKSAEITMFADIYQKTGEDWQNVSMLLSTGKPGHSLKEPVLYSWQLDVIRRQPKDDYDGIVAESKPEGASGRAKRIKTADDESEDFGETVQVRESGVNVEIAFAQKVSVESSQKKQKKFIKTYDLNNDGQVKFFYELFPQRDNKGFLKAALKNTSEMPWLPGQAQIFFDNEYMGKTTLPHVPPGETEEIVLGSNPSITAEKELVKKFEDTSGLFGGNRKIEYSYRILVENKTRKPAKVIVNDMIPVSRNEKIEIKIKNLSLQFRNDKEFIKTAEYGNGRRQWEVNMPANFKREITYTAEIIFDEKLNIRGLR